MNREKLCDLIVGNAPDTVDSAIATESSTKNDRIGWKGAYMFTIDNPYYTTPTPVLVKLRIPYRAHRTKYENPVHEKYCKHRCSRAEVLGFYSYYTGKELNTDIILDKIVWSLWTGTPYYVKGEMIRPTRYYDFEPEICGSGIHYFYEKESALMYLDWEFENYTCLRKNAFRRFPKKYA